MKHLTMIQDEIYVEMGTGPDILDLSPQLAQVIKASGIVDGTLHVTSIGSTGSVTSIEYEPGVVEDLCRTITRLAPPEDHYEHEEAWHDGNGHSHVQAALLGPSVVVPIRGRRMGLGTWQQVVLINHDNRARRRTVAVTIIGS